MTRDEAIAYLLPHPATSDGASISLKAGRIREAIAAISADIERAENRNAEYEHKIAVIGIALHTAKTAIGAAIENAP